MIFYVFYVYQQLLQQKSLWILFNRSPAPFNKTMKEPRSVVRLCRFLYYTGERGQCLNKKAHRSAPGGSGAGGSVVIFTKKLNGKPQGKISASGGSPVKCAHGTGGGKCRWFWLSRH